MKLSNTFHSPLQLQELLAEDSKRAYSQEQPEIKQELPPPAGDAFANLKDDPEAAGGGVAGDRRATVAAALPTHLNLVKRGGRAVRVCGANFA